ncbi:MAG TPA: adenylate/guanylate cyclase domain-containing protein [Candidatus Limnocylindrales bacterium]
MPEERRLVTVLFADVVGSTALGEELDPEDMRALLGRYFAIATDVVASHGGTLEKFIGDAVVAVFGLPTAHGDDPARALSTALELRDLVRDDPTLGQRLPVRIGVNTGEVVATRESEIGDQFLITGDAVNTAARLQQGAEAWQILAGERTVRAAGDTFAFGAASTVDAKGKAAPVAVRLLLGLAPARQARHLPIVGRDDDLLQLELVARRTFGERRPYLVSVIAPPGTGKTRLLEEFLSRLPRLAEEAVVAMTQCLPYGQRLTYSPLRSLLLRILDLPDDLPPDVIRSKARAWLSEAGDEAADRTGDLLAATLGSGEVEGVDRVAVFAAWRSLVELAASRRPLVLVIEDLHWSSDSLLDLIEAVLQPRGAAPLLMLVLARPELLDRRPAWGGGRRNYISLALEPLGDAAVRSLVEQLLDGPAPEIVRRVVARAEGNPFYAGEIVRSILERAPGLDDPAAVEAAVEALPDSVQGTVLARIDLLPPAARRALQVGSVFGRSFAVAGLESVEPELAADVWRAVEDLVDRDLVRPTATDSYDFRHILIREVAYGTLPRTERSRLHAAAARWLESMASRREDELAELIAYHYREAATVGAMLGPVPEDVRVGAVAWLRRAADVAMAGAANYEAARHLRSAIDLAHPEDLPELHERLGDVLVSGDAAIAAYAEALRQARELGRPADQVLGLLASELIVWTRWAGSVASARSGRVDELIAQGERLLPATHDPRQQARFRIGHSFRATMTFGAGNPDAVAAAAVTARKALDLARSIDDADLQSMAYDAIGSAAMASDDYRQSLDVALERLRLEERLSVSEGADARIVAAWSRAARGEFRESLAISAGLAGTLGPGQGLTFQLGAIAWEIAALHVLGRWNEAIARVRRMEEIWNETERTAAGYSLNGWLAALEIARARRDEELIGRLRVAIDDITDRFYEGSRVRRLAALANLDLEAISHDIIGDIGGFVARQDHVDRAIAICADRAFPLDPNVVRGVVAYMDVHGIRLVAAQARRALGIVTADAAPLRTALDEFEAMGAVPYAARARTELGLLTGDDAMYESGVAGLEALGDVDQLARIAARRKAAG